ncbi:uncharacterized protein FIBRA_01477 [Fibroporia radiculosa]|uniref:DUF676 domain-containing protein n=1 Tax=Fibroporia radiculosa TaxID=599839 RepID=J4H157_9APHY|nr:uncharacterized protein FIBRA_01477 [Fibroporia radiculosa]CCL99459.1 predicted protein [Fibroporia radiculosa]
MQSLWLPSPVFVLLRRVVNVFSTLSISQQYLRQRSQLVVEDARDAPDEGTMTLWEAFKYIKWPGWINLERGAQPITVTLGADFGSEAINQSDISDPPDDIPLASPSIDTLHQLLRSPALYDPVRKPRYPIALCHGLYGFDVRGPAAFPILQQHYWSNVLNILRQKVGAEVLVTSVPSTGSIASRAEILDRFLQNKAPGRGINFIAHSMGGLDCRHLISHIRPTDYTPLSLTTIATPHRGSPFMDWCRENIGLGRLQHKGHAATSASGLAEIDASAGSSLCRNSQKQVSDERPSEPRFTLSLASLPSSFTTLLLSVLDSPAYANLTSTYLNNEFNPATPDHPSVKYFSVAGRISGVGVWHPLWLPKMVLDGFEERERERLRQDADPLWTRKDEWGNDCLVTIQSARWGEFLGVLEGCDHWDVRGARGIEVDLPSVTVPGLNKVGDGWNLADWGKFVRAWKSEEKAAAKSAGAGISEQTHEKVHQRVGNYEREHADEVLKSSTDKLSAVFDWIVEQVPANPLTSLATADEGSRWRLLPDSNPTPWKEAPRQAASEALWVIELKLNHSTSGPVPLLFNPTNLMPSSLFTTFHVLLNTPMMPPAPRPDTLEIQLEELHTSPLWRSSFDSTLSMASSDSNTSTPLVPPRCRESAQKAR